MNFKVFGKIGQVLAVGILAVSVVSCDSDDDNSELDNSNRADEYFNIVYTSSHTNNTEAYIQASTDPSKGVITFNKFGYEIPSTRTPRVFASNDGRVAYNIDYGGGTLSSFDVYGGQDYRITNQKVISNVLGTEYGRGTKVNDANMLVHSVNSDKFFDKDSNYLYYKANASILDIDLDGLKFGNVAKFELIANEEDKKKGLYIFRIDAPVIAGGKAYYGFAMSYRNPVTGEAAPSGFVRPTYKSQSLVLDYPSLTNPKVIASNVSKGSTYGYRIPVSHIDESGDVYQITETHMLKIKDGKYDDTYVFDISKTGIGARGWFYAGNGIGYATIFDLKKGSSSDAKAWGVARIDIRNKTIIEMNVDDDLSLGQYQMAKVGKDGKVYMALSPVGKEGYIYIFDPKVDNADGFVKGAKLTNHGSGASYVGVF